MAETMLNTEGLDDLNGRFLTFNIADSVYGIELLHVIEIINIQSITRVPNVPHYIKGIINLRGKVVPVIDVRVKFNMEEHHSDSPCVIVVVIENMHVGLIVDSVSEVVTIDVDDLSQPPQLGAGEEGNKYLKSVMRIGSRVILNIDCNKFFASDLTDSGF